jgi:hypothetical protein
MPNTALQNAIESLWLYNEETLPYGIACGWNDVNCNVQVEAEITLGLKVGQYVSVPSPLWDLRLDITSVRVRIYCHNFESVLENI